VLRVNNKSVKKHITNYHKTYEENKQRDKQQQQMGRCPSMYKGEK
jgi:hypothetical protein